MHNFYRIPFAECLIECHSSIVLQDRNIICLIEGNNFALISGDLSVDKDLKCEQATAIVDKL